MKPKSQKDFLSGLMFIVVGTAFGVGATNFDVGSAARMGPGYFPLLLGVVLALLGVIITAQSFRGRSQPDGGAVGAIAWRQLIFILCGNLVFGALLVGVPMLGIPHFGLIVAIYGLVLTVGYARKGHRIKESLVLATVLAIGSYAAFVYALNLQFPVLPWFLGH